MYDLIVPRGYTYEEHYPVTKDGYILGLYRIPNGKAGAAPTSGAPAGERKVVLLWHGLIDSSSAFVINPPPDVSEYGGSEEESRGLGLRLADEGYDVWMGNVRGNFYSRNHTFLNPSEDDIFWDFRIDDHALTDLPTVLEYIRQQTGEQPIYYAGHSQGTTMFLMYFSEHPENQGWIEKASLLAPVGSLGHTTSGLRNLLPLVPLLRQAAPSSLIPGNVSNSIGRLLCDVADPLCVLLIEWILGYSSTNIPPSLLEYYVTFTPSGTSVTTLLQWAQQYVRGRRTPRQQVLALYDYGSCIPFISCDFQPNKCNRCVYGTGGPSPTVDLSKIDRIPISAYSGDVDKLADPIDVELTLGALGTTVRHKVLPGYGHADFVYALDANRDVFDDVVSFFSQ